MEAYGLLTVQCICGAGLEGPVEGVLARAASAVSRRRPPNPAVELSYGRVVKRSSVVPATTDPVWRRETLSFEVDVDGAGAPSPRLLGVAVWDAAKEDASLGTATLDISPVLSGREKQLDTWVDLEGVKPGARVRLAVAFDVLEPQPRPGDRARLSGLWPEHTTKACEGSSSSKGHNNNNNATFGLRRADPALVVLDVRGDDVLVGYEEEATAATSSSSSSLSSSTTTTTKDQKNVDRFVLKRNAIRKAPIPTKEEEEEDSGVGGGSYYNPTRAAETVVDSLSRGASALAASPAAEAVAARTQKVLQGDLSAEAAGDLARDGLASLSFVARRWQAGGAAAARSDVLYALGATDAPAEVAEGNDDDEEEEEDARMTAPPRDEDDEASRQVDGAGTAFDKSLSTVTPHRVKTPDGGGGGDDDQGDASEASVDLDALPVVDESPIGHDEGGVFEAGLLGDDVDGAALALRSPDPYDAAEVAQSPAPFFLPADGTPPETPEVAEPALPDEEPDDEYDDDDDDDDDPAKNDNDDDPAEDDAPLPDLDAGARSPPSAPATPPGAEEDLLRPPDASEIPLAISARSLRSLAPTPASPPTGGAPTPIGLSLAHLKKKRDL